MKGESFSAPRHMSTASHKYKYKYTYSTDPKMDSSHSCRWLRHPASSIGTWGVRARTAMVNASRTAGSVTGRHGCSASIQTVAGLMPLQDPYAPEAVGRVCQSAHDLAPGRESGGRGRHRHCAGGQLSAGRHGLGAEEGRSRHLSLRGRAIADSSRLIRPSSMRRSTASRSSSRSSRSRWARPVR